MWGFAAIGDIDSGRIWAIVLGVLLAIVAIALLVASWTRWGQTKSLTKCIILAFLAHVWLLMYAYGTRIVMPGSGGGYGGGPRYDAVSMPISVFEQPPADLLESTPESSDTDANQETEADSLETKSWEAPLQPAEEMQAAIPSLLPSPKVEPAVEPPPLMESMPIEPLLPDLPSVAQIEELAAVASQVTEPAPTVAATPPTTSATSIPVSAKNTNSVQLRKLDHQPVPMNYQMRLSPNRFQYALSQGGDANSEAAVERALAWLARAQSPSGAWNAAEHGAGREPTAASPSPDGENRHNAGLKANTGMTGLALLAMLGAGHTHVEGTYSENVARGLRYLLSQQLPSGDLSGRDQIGREPTVRYARMYSHGMAGLALTEAYGMTGDPALVPAIQAACRYTMSAMNPRSGGWRYEFPTEDPGDMSQFGWQAMLLNSAASHGTVELQPGHKQLMQRFLDSVATGRNGGLAVYRPRFGQPASAEQATPSMTAEAMASRMLLSFPVAPMAAEEAQRMMLRNLPGQGEENLYYWYYATLAMYQLRGEATVYSPNRSLAGNPMSNEAAWTEWNEALKRQLCSTQVSRGTTEGSWNPTCIWGGYGGRVYSTAVACMSLEVYYRYLPMYKPEQIANRWQPAQR